jgi:hypothetical protein
MANAILPYRSLGETIGISLDLNEAPHKAIGEHSVLVDTAAAGESITIDIKAQLPSGIPQLFAKQEQKNPPIEVVGTITSVDASSRRTIPLQKQKPNLYSGRVKLDLTQITESAELSVFVVRKTNGPGGQGIATHKGSRLAWSPNYEIRFVEPPTKGKLLDIRWDDFSEPKFVPESFPDALYYIDPHSEQPVIYLNSAMANELKSLVNTKGHSPPKALPRDVIFHSMANAGYLTLAQETIKALHEEGATSGTPVNAEDLFSGSWKLEMYELIAPLLNPSILPEAAKVELCTKINETNYFGEVMARAQLAIQSHLGVRDLYEKLAKKAFENV